ncbi:MAG: PQQ-dependent sugar dehydrogenase, partial [Planctomycetes bacterium]|nr:PQQ-dependent sugar dehydrogenase [Planctomycetota bacterium]
FPREYFMRTRSLGLIVIAILCSAASTAQAQLVPNGFVVETVVSSGLNGPHGFCFLPDGRPLIFEVTGPVKMFVNGSLVTVGTVPSVETGSERGLLAVVADPNFAQNGFLYTWSSRTASSFMWLSRFTCTGDLNNAASTNLSFAASSQFVLINTAPDNAFNHNGGSLAFANDGMLLLSIGDDASSCSARSETTLSGVLLRLATSGLPAGAGSATLGQLDPGNNPLSGGGGVSSLVMAKGLRNPWRFTYDSGSGFVYLGDVGAGAREEIDEIPYPPTGLQDYGWPIFEGNLSGSSCSGGPFPNLLPPVLDVDHSQGWFSIFSGPRYRNQTGNWDFGPNYEGDWFFGDYSAGQIRRLKYNGTSWSTAASVPGQPSSANWGTGFSAVSQMDVGPDGAIYFTQHSSPGNFGGGTFRRIRTLGPVDQITLLSGGAQVGVRGSAFKAPVVFQVADNNGVIRPNHPVTVAVINGTASTGANATTDASGQVSINVSPNTQGNVTVSVASAASGLAQASLFARGLNLIYVTGATSDNLIVQFINTTNGSVPVPLLFGASSPPFGPFPTQFGPLGMDLFSLNGTTIIEDGGGQFGGVSNSPGGGFGTPSKVAVYSIPAGALAGMTGSFQAIWFDQTVLTSVAGTTNSNLGFSNIVTMTF